MREDDEMPFLLQYEHVAWYEHGCVRILDRRCYPMEVSFVICRSYHEVAQAIKDMVTQSGGPFTALTMGLVLAAQEAKGLTGKQLEEFLSIAGTELSTARPTTSEKMKLIVLEAMQEIQEEIKQHASHEVIRDVLFRFALHKLNERYHTYRKVASYLEKMVPAHGVILTQCFGETVIGCLLRECRHQGKQIQVVCAETRPFLQGARLTASVAADMGFEVKVITDNMVGSLMQNQRIDVFTSAADAITMDGYVVNKIGTYQMALLAFDNDIPYFVTGTPNQEHPLIDDIVIEYRDPSEVTTFLGRKIVKEGVGAMYPAFDITRPSLISGVVTDKGIMSPYDLHEYFTSD